jgi:hypothetical protein
MLKSISVAMLIGAAATLLPKTDKINQKKTKRQEKAADASVATAGETAKVSEQSAVVAKSTMSDERMAVDYNGYYYGTSGNVEEY